MYVKHGGPLEAAIAGLNAQSIHQTQTRTEFYLASGKISITVNGGLKCVEFFVRFRSTVSRLHRVKTCWLNEKWILQQEELL